MTNPLTSFSAQNDPPVAPNNLIATPQLGAADLTWDSNELEEHEVCVEMCTDNENFVEIRREDGDLPGVTVGSLSNGTTYYFRVRSVLRGVYSKYSNIAFATPEEGGSR